MNSSRDRQSTQLDNPVKVRPLLRKFPLHIRCRTLTGEFQAPMRRADSDGIETGIGETHAILDQNRFAKGAQTSMH